MSDRNRQELPSQTSRANNEESSSSQSKQQTANNTNNNDVDAYQRWVPLKQRAANNPSLKKRRKKEEVEEAKVSLLQQRAERLLRNEEDLLNEHEQELEEQRKIEEEIMKSYEHMRPLQAASLRAEGIEFKDSLNTSWRPTKRIMEMSGEEAQQIRKEYGILVEGSGVVNPTTNFEDLRLPKAILRTLANKKIFRPTPIQMQALPVILSGRDLIGIAFTGSGKTLAFVTPAVCFALEEEQRMPLTNGEGPVAVLISPSRELAAQTYELTRNMAHEIRRGGGPELNVVLCIGGAPVREQEMEVGRGCHIVVGTPGRIADLLNRKKFNMKLCRYLCLDEADRLVDVNFEEEIRNIVDHIKDQVQTLLFSATMAKKVKDFAKSTLVNPIEVNVGRAGAANLDVFQEVEVVKEESKILYILECLQKTGPPVLIFAENQRDVDSIHEFLLYKGVEAVALHGRLSLEERQRAVQLFKEGKKDVLVATDVGSKGLDFPNVQHVINYDMPREIENYVHRIGRTGRCGKTGVATTFINKNSDTTVLLDLKQLLLEARQRIPAALQAFSVENSLPNRPCARCGGLGHRLLDCPKMQKEARQGGRNAAGGEAGGW